MPVKRLSPVELHDILSKHLAPMFPGTSVLDSPIPTTSPDTVVQESPCEVLVRPDPEWDNCFRIRKTHPFEADDIQIIEKFAQALHEKLSAVGEPFFQYLIDKCAQDVVAFTMQPRFADDYLLPAIITLLRKWSSETYEGQRISVAIGVDPSTNLSRISNVHLSQISGEDYTKVLSNGLDTLLVLSSSGHVVDHINTVEPTNKPATRLRGSAFAPRRHKSLASWARNARVAFVLNRHGEILVFRNERLRFAFRRGIWSHFDHSAMIARMGGSLNLMRAVYATCLDISFARTGGCIAVAHRPNVKKTSDYLGSYDRLSKPIGEKAILMRHLIGERFERIPRSIREELAALDGAVVLDYRGEVLAVGAIVSVPGGSDGGGRKAAAKALSRLGLAVKISADGGMTAYTNRGTRKNPEVAFEVGV
jgi:hypothetical protein